MAFVKAGVIGYPVKKSKSPLIYNYWIDRYGLDGKYYIFETKPDDFKNEVKRLVEDEGVIGLSVTIPYKQEVMPLCHHIDKDARAMGAVNRILVIDGKLHGSNTDVFGFIQNIKISRSDFDFKDGKAVVLGAGGAARSIVYGLVCEGVPEIVVTNRTREKAEELVFFAPDRIKVADWEDREKVLEDANLLVNATCLGMEGMLALEISLEALPVSAVVNDIVYYPLETALISLARLRGNPVVTGIGMLLQQARPQFKRWFGVMPEITDELKEMVLK